MVGADVLRGDMPVADWGQNPDAVVLDVREKPELAVEGVPGSIHIPLGQLRTRLEEPPEDPFDKSIEEVAVRLSAGETTRCG